MSEQELKDSADRAIAEAAHEFGFDSSERYLEWMDLEFERRANLLLRPSELLGEPLECQPEVAHGFRSLLRSWVPRNKLRLLRASGRRSRVSLDFAVRHVSPLVGVSAAGTADDVEPIVGDAGGAEPLDAPPAPSAETARS